MSRLPCWISAAPLGACYARRGQTCLQLAIRHANSTAVQKTLGNFDLVKKKIARIAADVYAMEAMNVTASLIDRGLEDYMIETAMLKVFTTERLWMRSTMLPNSRRLRIF